jgi:hypothetical protein
MIRDARVANYDVTPYGKLEIKVRCRFVQNFQLQMWLHHEPQLKDYAYQLFSDHPILRWDNAPHYPAIATAPHHFHDELGKVSDSELTGETLHDLQYVLAAIEEWVSQNE